MQFDRIEIHFQTKDREPRTVVIDRDAEVRAIRLEKRPLQKDQPKAKGLRVEGGEVAIGDGPQVCYEIAGSLQCW